MKRRKAKAAMKVKSHQRLYSLRKHAWRKETTSERNRKTDTRVSQHPVACHVRKRSFPPAPNTTKHRNPFFCILMKIIGEINQNQVH